MSLKFNPNSNLGNLILSFSSPNDIPKKKVITNDIKYENTPKIIRKGSVKLPYQLNHPQYPRPDHFWCILHYLWFLNKQRKLDYNNRKLVLTGHYLAYQRIYGSSIGTQLHIFFPKINALWKVSYLNYKNKIKRYGKYTPKVVPNIYNSILFNNLDKIESGYITIQRVPYEQYGETLRLCG